MTLRAAIYARVSTDRQRERHTIDSQLRLLPQHAAREGWEVINIYKDDGKSGETVEGRPEFKRLLDDAADHQFDVVLVIDLDRITRSKRSAEGALIFDHFRENGVKLATPTQGVIDLDDEDQDLLVGIKRELAKWEKRKIVARMMRGKREAAKKGRRFSSLDPFGYRWAPDTESPRGGAYQIVDDEADVVRRMYDLALRFGINMVAWTLNQEGHRTRAIKRASRPNGGSGAWATSTVGRVLRSTTYRGEFQVFKKEADIPAISVPPIIDADTWARVQAALQHRKPQTRFKHNREYLVSGFVRCGVCGYAMWVVNARPTGHHKHAYYRCCSTNAWRKMKMDGPCGNRHHRVDLVDAVVWAKLIEVLRDPSLLAEACALAREPEGIDWTAQAKAAQKKLSDLVKLEAELLRRRRRNLISATACDRELGEIAREREATERNLEVAEQQLGDVGSRRKLLKDIGDHAALLAAGLERATFEERRTLVRLLIPIEHGCFVKLHKNGSIEIRGILPTPTKTLELRVTAKAG